MTPATAESAPADRLPRFARRAPPNHRVTERDAEIIRAAALYRVIDSDQLYRLVEAIFPGSSKQQVLRRMRTMFDAGYLARPRRQVETYQSGSRPMIVMPGNRGSEFVAERFGFRRAAVDWTAKARTAVRGEMHHALSVTEFVVSLDIACKRRASLRVLDFQTLLSTMAPDETRASRHPYQWPVITRWKGREVVLHIAPDAIFGVQDLDRPEGANRKFFFLESDRGTMPTTRQSLDKTSILRKLISYAESHRRDIPARRYGLTNARVLIVTTGRQRIANIIAAYREHASALVSPKFFLFADRAGLSRAQDWLDYPWIDAAGEQHRLLD